MRMMKTLWLLGAAALALGLSGCGGGGSTRPDTSSQGGGAPPKDLTEKKQIPDVMPDELGAKGVTVEISRVSDATVIAFKKGDKSWSTTPSGGDAGTKVSQFSNGWEGKAVVNASATARIVAYTNIDVADRKPFHEVKGPAPYKVGSEVVLLNSAQHIKYFLSPKSTLYTFKDDTGTEINERTFSAKLAGAEGRFTCTADPCTLSWSTDVADNDTWALSNGWTFKAKDAATIGVPDSDYLAFGYWNRISKEKKLVDFVPFHYGSMPYSGNVQALSGRAIYNGGAAGGYEHNTYNPTTGKAIPTYGHFIAGVTLSAFFGGEGGTSTIDGSVTGFSLSGLTIKDVWKTKTVGLNRVEITGRHFTGGTTGTSDDGTWSGAFYGPSADGALPTGVAGEFDATLDNGAVTGAYGATR